jgi:hypothetical protein
MFLDDRLLLVATAILAIVSLAPILLTPILPLVDLGSSVGAAGLLDDVVRGRPVPSAFYQINWAPIPYWTGYAIMSFLDVLFGPYLAAKATVALTVVLLPVAAMRLLRALGRSPRLGLWVFLLAWDVNTYWGWFTFQLGMSLALYAIARIVEITSWRDALRVAPVVALVGLTHAHATALVGVVGLLLVLAKPRRLQALWHHLIALGGFVVLFPWIIARLVARSGKGDAVVVVSATLAYKISALFKFSMDVLPHPTAVTFTKIAFALLAFGPFALAAVPQVKTSTLRQGVMAVLICAACVLLYLTLPFAVSGAFEHWWTYPRYASYILATMPLLPAPDLSGRRAWLLLPGVVLVVCLNIARAAQFAAFGAKTRPYLAIVDAMPPNSRFLPLDFEFAWSGTREWPLGQLHGYAAAARASYDPHLFDHLNSPLLFRPEARLPIPDWRYPARTFSMRGQGRFYDYIITYPKLRDIVPRAAGNEVQLVKESGDWRLYKVLAPR